MPQISRTALVPFSAEQMYQLVNDVKSYPDFLPGCTGSRVLEFGPTQMTAAVDVSKAGISKTFTTRNKLIEMAFGRVFKELAANMVQAFTSRAKEVYSAS